MAPSPTLAGRRAREAKRPASGCKESFLKDRDTFRIVARGSIHGHEAGGTVVLETSDGGSRLRLEDYWIAQGAPDVRIYLTPSATGDVGAEGTLELGRVSAFSGSKLAYAIPAQTFLEHAAAVVIYCKAFSVTFGVALLEPL